MKKGGKKGGDHRFRIARFCVYGIVLIAILTTVGMLRDRRSEQISTEPAPAGEPSATLDTEPVEPYEITPQPEEGKADLSDWKLLLVNPWHPLPKDFSVELQWLDNGQAVDKRAYPELRAMMDDAGAEGLSPVICSSYRTEENQKVLFENKISRLLSAGYSRKDAESEAGKWVAVPGTSEHQAGLAVDIVASSYRLLDEQQENTAEQKWLMENAYRYGFILRYPREKTEITGIGYEPWHYRYVGREAAEEIYEQGLCLEEYLERLDVN